jgi:hypothetical protein
MNRAAVIEQLRAMQQALEKLLVRPESSEQEPIFHTCCALASENCRPLAA